MNSRLAAAALAALLVISVTVQAQAQPGGEPAGEAGRAAGQGRRGGRGGGDPFAGQPRIKALIVSGGCCHDYSGEAKVLMDSISKVLPVDWTVAVQGGRGTVGRISLYDNPNWIAGFDIVIHNECFADVTDPAYIRNITTAHRGGIPAMVIHCSMHSYRAAEVDDWREFLGVTSRRHTQAHNIAVKITAPDERVMKGMKTDWVTPVDELYVIDKVWPNAKGLATAVSPEDHKEYPLVWINNYNGTARVFGTTIGHGEATWNDPVYQDLLARGFKWALKRD
jgi:type 1 glutamine amidotransferase